MTEISSLLSQLRKEGMEIYPNEIAVDGIECLGTGDISFRASCAFGAGIMKVLRYEFAKSLGRFMLETYVQPSRNRMRRISVVISGRALLR